MESFGYSHPVTPYPLPDLGTHCPVSAGPMSCNPSLDCLPGASEAQGSAYQPRPRLAQLHPACHSQPHVRHQAWLTLQTTRPRIVGWRWRKACVPSRRDGNNITNRHPKESPPQTSSSSQNHKKSNNPPTPKEMSENSGPRKQSTPSTPHPNINQRPPSRAAPQPRFNTPRSDPKITHFKKPKVPTHALFLTVCNTLQVSHSRAGMLQPRLDYQPALPCCVWCALLCFALPAGRTNTARSAHVFVKPFPPAGQHVWTFPTNNKTSSEYVTE